MTVKDQNGDLKASTTILDEIAQKWNSGMLTNIQKQEIAFKAAGANRMNYFVSLMDHYNRYQDLLKAGMNSEGAATKANEKYMNSIEGKAKALKNSMETLFLKSLQSDEVKKVLDMLTQLVNVISMVTDKFGLLGTAFIAINTKALMSSKLMKDFTNTFIQAHKEGSNFTQSISKGFGNLNQNLEKWISGVNKIKISYNDFNKKIQESGKAVNVTADSIKKWGSATGNVVNKSKGLGVIKQVTQQAGTAAKTSAVSFKALAGSIDMAKISAVALQAAFSFGLSIALTAAFEGISKLANKSKDLKDKLNDVAKSTPAKLSDLGHYSVMADQMDKLQKKANKTAEEEKQLKDIQKELAQQFPSTITGFDKEGNAMSSNAEAIQKVVQAKEALLKLELQKTIQETSKDVGEARGKVEKATKAINEDGKAVANIVKEYTKAGKSEKEIADATKLYTNRIEKNRKVLYENKATVDAYDGAMKVLQGTNNAIADSILKNINANRENKASLEEARAALMAAGLSTDEINQALDKYQQQLNAASQGNDDVANSADAATQAMNNLSDEFSGAVNSVDFYNKVLQEYNENGKISAGTMAQIMGKHRELLPLLADEGTFKEKLTALTQQQQQVATNAYNSAIQQAVNQGQVEQTTATNTANTKVNETWRASGAMTDSMHDATNGMGQAYQDDVNNFNGACNAKINMANQTGQAIANSMSALIQSIGQTTFNFANKAYTQEIDSMNGADRANKLAEISRQVFSIKTTSPLPKFTAANPVGIDWSPKSSGGGGGRGRRKGSGGGGSGSGKRGRPKGSGSGSGSGSSSHKEEVKDLKLEIDRYKELNGRISALNSTLSYNKELEEQAAKTGKNEYIEKQIGLMKQLKNRYQDLQNEQYKERDELKSTLSANWFTFDGDGNINNYTSALKRLQDWSNQASGDDKKNRQDKVKEWQKDADKYIDLVSNKIPELDNKMLHINAEIKERLTKQTHIKIEILKDDLDKTIKEIDDKMKELDWKENTLGDKDLSSHMYIDTAKLNETSKKYDETLKMLNKLRNVSAQTEEAQKELKDSIRETENQLWEYSNAIQQLNEKIEQSRINNIKNVADDSKKALEYDRQMLDYRESQLSDKNTQHVEFAEAKLDNEAKKYTILANQLNELNNLKLNGLVKTAKAQEELNESIKETTKETLEVCQNIQSLKEEIDSANLNNLSNKYDEDIKNVTESQSDLDSSINRLADDDKDLAQKLDLTNKKYEDQQQAIKITEEYLEKLKNTKAQTQKGEEDLKEKIQETTDALREQKNAADELNKSMDEMILNTIDKVIDKQQSVEEKELEDKQKQENKALEEMYFKTTQTEYDEYKKNKIESLKEEIDLLKQKAEKNEDNHALLENVKAKELEIFDLENQHYDKIENWYEVHQAMHQFKIDAIDKELEKMEEEDKLDKEKEDRLKYQNELLKAQQDIENIKRNKNIQQLKQEADGSWQYEYTYDIDKLDKAQKDYANKEKEYKKWEDDLAKKKKKDELNKKKQEEKQALDDLKANYDKQVKLLEEKHEKEKDEMSRKYEEMKIKTREYLKQLKEEYKNNWDAILEGLQKEIGLGDQALDMFHKKSIDKINDIYKQLDALVEKMQGLGIATSTQLNIKPIQIYDTSKLPSRMPEIKMPEMDNSKEEIKQEVHINAEFPDVNNADEIKEALESLSTSATQYLGRK